MKALKIFGQAIGIFIFSLFAIVYGLIAWALGAVGYLISFMVFGVVVVGAFLFKGVSAITRR